MLLFIFFLCWGSLLNVIAHRLVSACSFVTGRSRCPACSHVLSWYDLVPLVSWVLLRGQCRHCHAPISWLYPTIELFTATTLTSLYYHVPSVYFPLYAFFISALIITIRSDIETMLISRFVTIFLIPIGFLASTCGLLPIALVDSIGGALIGSGFLWIIATIFCTIRGKEGIGQGDIDLLAFIGSFLGVIGCWLALCIGALMGACVGILHTILHKKTYDLTIRIPFGPFLALGAIIVIFFHDKLIQYWFMAV